MLLNDSPQLLAPLEDLEAAFSIWRQHRDQVLGFEPRVIVCDGDEDRSEEPSTGIGLPLLGYGIGGEVEERPTGCKYRFMLSGGHFDVVVRHFAPSLPSS